MLRVNHSSALSQASRRYPDCLTRMSLLLDQSRRSFSKESFISKTFRRSRETGKRRMYISKVWLGIS